MTTSGNTERAVSVRADGDGRVLNLNPAYKHGGWLDVQANTDPFQLTTDMIRRSVLFLYDTQEDGVLNMPTKAQLDAAFPLWPASSMHMFTITTKSSSEPTFLESTDASVIQSGVNSIAGGGSATVGVYKFGPEGSAQLSANEGDYTFFFVGPQD